MINEFVNFRILSLFCCNKLLCWVAKELPDYCPRCGRMLLGESMEATVIDEQARLCYGVQEGEVLPLTGDVFPLRMRTLE